jgi:pyruvate ferredoxin oxidoreductase gamma subunit
MRELTIVARAGQGALTAAEILAIALHRDGKHPLAFPHFGAERMGAPMNAFVRWDHRPVRLRNQILTADYALYFDPSLMSVYPPDKLVKTTGCAFVNSGNLWSLNGEFSRKIWCLPADRLVRESLGRVEGINVIMIAFFSALTREISYASLEGALRERFQGSALKKNLVLLEQGFNACPDSVEVFLK